MILVTFDIMGAPITAVMSREEFMDQVLNNHGNLTRPRYPYTWKRIENATPAELAKAKKIRINDPHDPEILAAKAARKAKKFDQVRAEGLKSKADQAKRIADGIKAKKAEKTEV